MANGWGGADPPGVVYFYAEGRGGDHAEGFLDGFGGTLQVDAYPGYNRLTRADRPGGPLVLANCWAHARRKLREIYERDGSTIAAEGLRRIAEFYRIEGEIRGRPPEARLAARQQRTAPLVQAFKLWLKQARARVSAKSRLGEKLGYIARNWAGLEVFLTDGRVEIDSNAVENKIRPLALNRKNALFAGHDEGGRAWGRIASLIETAKMNGVEPFAYANAPPDHVSGAEMSGRALFASMPPSGLEKTALPPVHKCVADTSVCVMYQPPLQLWVSQEGKSSPAPSTVTSICGQISCPTIAAAGARRSTVVRNGLSSTAIFLVQFLFRGLRRVWRATRPLDAEGEVELHVVADQVGEDHAADVAPLLPGAAIEGDAPDALGLEQLAADVGERTVVLAMRLGAVEDPVVVNPACLEAQPIAERLQTIEGGTVEEQLACAAAGDLGGREVRPA